MHLGRGSGSDASPNLTLFRQRPGFTESRPPLVSPGLSRQQLELQSDGRALTVKNTGKGELLIDDRVASGGRASMGSTLHIRNQLVLLIVQRPLRLPATQSFLEDGWLEFGSPDRFGIVGESPSAWDMRENLAFIGQRQDHVLIFGESGTGKELAAKAIHGASPRGGGPMVARNAATIPQGLIDAELFGNIENYPHAGLPARAGLFGEAHGGTLFLDEIAELPLEMQAHLLRVLDQGGEYQRLGDTKRSQTDVRLLGATNRDRSQLKDDVAARFSLEVQIPTLNERPEDIPLLIRALLRSEAQKDPLIQAHFMDANGQERLEPQLVEALVKHRYTHHVRELRALLWLSIRSAQTRDHLPLSAELRAKLTPKAQEQVPTDISEAELKKALAQSDGNRTKAARALGLSSRHVVYRLLKRYGIED